MVFKGYVLYKYNRDHCRYTFKSLAQLLNSSNDPFFMPNTGGLENPQRKITKFVLSKETITEIQNQLDLREK